MKNIFRRYILTPILLILAVYIINTATAWGECSQTLENTYLSSTDPSVAKYTVQSGDTLYSIATEYHVALDELMKANKLKNSLILAGETLQLPAAATTLGKMSREEVMLLARVIHAEARGESFEGQVAVGAVVLNRLTSPHFPKTIHDIVFQKNKRVYQFSPVGDGSINLEPDERAVQAALQAMSGEDPSKGALFFYNPNISSDKWIKTLPVITTIGNHVFATSY
ncbi:MAG: LysM peptidoglycan-binding domain-containing protein [Peptococcaceae bacterium]|nr:LysM peptidoglycan-binding domain-containing protein [Candidatus Syntrophopropionicum ammoniitolerans]